MFGMVRYVKGRLSHVQATSWHYQMVEAIWGWRAKEGKACTYYWIKFPSSFIAFCFCVVLLAISTIFGFFIGRFPTYFKASDPDLKLIQDRAIYYPYKTLPSGRRIPVAPWEVVVSLGLLWVIYYIITELGMITAGILTGATLVVLLIFLLYKSEKVRMALWRAVVNAYNKACPPLVVE